MDILLFIFEIGSVYNSHCIYTLQKSNLCCFNHCVSQHVSLMEPGDVGTCVRAHKTTYDILANEILSIKDIS